MQTKETAIVRHQKSRKSYTAIFCEKSEYLCIHVNMKHKHENVTTI